MATLNLGRIKPVFRGAYSGATAYVVDDIVTSSDETFICILASTGNATSNATYWTKLAAKGTDGTDLTSTLTTRGDIVYKGASALTRLPKGTAGYYLKQGANDPEWSAVASGGDVSQVRTTANQSFNDTSNWTTFTGLSLSVTPSSTSTKLLIILNTYANINGSQGWGLRLKKDGTVIATQKTTHAVYQGTGGDHEQNHFFIVHAPNTTSSITFTVEAKNNNNNAVLLNDGDHSTMTIVEIG